MRKRVAVIGAGLGGMAASIVCAAQGHEVTVFEKNAHAGGKCDILTSGGFTFDLGPSILILPSTMRMLFRIAGKELEEYVVIKPLDLHWRNFFEDGSVVDLYADPRATADHFEKIIPGSARQFERYLDFARRNLTILYEPYFAKSSDTLFQILRTCSWSGLAKLDFLHSMHERSASFFTDRHLSDIFDYFIKYVGSSAYRAPSFMHLLAAAQWKEGLFYVKGGIYELARGYERLLRECGGTLRFGSEVTDILVAGSRVKGVALLSGETIAADAVISNMEVIPAYERLLHMEKHFMQSLTRFEPSCSGLVLHLGLNRTYEQLGHHNFFYSRDPRTSFRSTFEEYHLPDDPTIYLVAPSRTDPAVAPPGCENIKILPHIPHLQKIGKMYSRVDYEVFADRVLKKIERMGLEGLRSHIIFSDLRTPLDIERLYFSNLGSIYGVVTDRWKNFGFKAPKQSKRFSNLFFAGGSVNPGGGMPMVTLSGLAAGQMACEFLK
jgi:diapolycopene oxygenase